MKFKILYTLFYTLVFLLFACTQKNDNKETAYNFYEVIQENLVEYIETNGSVEPKNNINVYAPSRGGRLEKLFVKEGDRVRKGQVLAIMSSDSRVEILDMAAHESLNEKKYWEKQILPTKIFAPMSGKIYEILTLPGNTIRGAIAKISDKLIVNANIDEIDVAKLRVGSEVKINFDANESKLYSGQLNKISEVSRKINNVNIYVVDITFNENIFDEKKFRARSGMSVTVKIPVAEQHHALALPTSAVNNQSNKKMKVTLKNGSQRNIQLGKIYADKVHVKGGLEKGDYIRVEAFDSGNQENKQSIINFFKK